MLELPHALRVGEESWVARRLAWGCRSCAASAALREAGVECVRVEVGELREAAGAIACLTRILQRDEVG